MEREEEEDEGDVARKKISVAERTPVKNANTQCAIYQVQYTSPP
jgi:hypothetical protein